MAGHQGDLRVVELLGDVPDRVVVLVEPPVEEQCGDLRLVEGPLVAAHEEGRGWIGALDLRLLGDAAVPAVQLRAGRVPVDLEVAGRVPPHHVEVDHRHRVGQGADRLLHVPLRSEEADLLPREEREDRRAPGARPLPRHPPEGAGHEEDRRGAAGVVVRAPEHGGVAARLPVGADVPAGAEVVEVRPEDHALGGGGRRGGRVGGRARGRGPLGRGAGRLPLEDAHHVRRFRGPGRPAPGRGDVEGLEVVRGRGLAALPRGGRRSRREARPVQLPGEPGRGVLVPLLARPTPEEAGPREEEGDLLRLGGGDLPLRGRLEGIGGRERRRGGEREEEGRGEDQDAESVAGHGAAILRG